MGWGRKVTSTISRNGDLISTAYLEIVLKRKVANDVNGTPFYPAENLIKEVELEIGGQRIDKHYSDYFRMYDEVFRTNSEKEAYRRMTNFDTASPDAEVRRFYLPLLFFFNRSPGLALPLIALQYHEVKVSVTIATADEMAKVGVDTAVDPAVSLWVNYVFLDADERRRFAQTSHEVLITQLQHTGAETIAPDAASRKQATYRLNLNHPVKFLLFGLKHPDIHGKFTTASDRQAYDDAYAPLYESKLSLNGHDRFAAKKASWFNGPSVFETTGARPCAGVYFYSFALKPSEHQPSGTCNFSRIDNATLYITTKAGSAGTARANITSEEVTLGNVTSLSSLLVFAENYNVLRILSGMGGLSYSS